jgi:Ca2+-binding RTX toxin-like protein
MADFIEVTRSELQAAPYSRVGIVFVTFPNSQEYSGTFALVGRNDILTATHVVFNPELGGLATKLEFYLGADFNKITGEFETIGYEFTVIPNLNNVTYFKEAFNDSNNTMINSSESQYDVALVGTNFEVGDINGWLNINPFYTPDNSLASSIGYPQKTSGMMVKAHKVLEEKFYWGGWTHVFKNNDEDVLRPGSSGGPLIHNNYVVGVASGGTSSSATWADLSVTYFQLVNAMMANDSLLPAGSAERLVFDFSWVSDTSILGSNADEIFVQKSNDINLPKVINGSGGNDTITGGNGYDSLLGGSGEDRLYGNGGFDSLDGGAGNDILDGGLGNDSLDGGEGDDSLDGGAGTDTVYYNSSWSNYTISGTSSSDSVIDKTGINGADILFNIEKLRFTDKTFTVIKKSGNATTYLNTIDPMTSGGRTKEGYYNGKLTGTGEADVINGGAYASADTITGGAGNDIIDGGAGNDDMAGNTGDDTYYVDSSKDKVTEKTNEGTDTVITTVPYTLANNVENLTLAGVLSINATGNTANNIMTGNSGANLINGGLGNDTLTGGLGNDTFVFNTKLGTTNIDTITDFASGDKIALAGSIFSKLRGDKDLSDNFNAAASDNNDYLIYDRANGKLYYDADGNGKAAAVQFVTLTGSPNLEFSDFIIV